MALFLLRKGKKTERWSIFFLNRSAPYLRHEERKSSLDDDAVQSAGNKRRASHSGIATTTVIFGNKFLRKQECLRDHLWARASCCNTSCIRGILEKVVEGIARDAPRFSLYILDAGESTGDPGACNQASEPLAGPAPLYH